MYLLFILYSILLSVFIRDINTVAGFVVDPFFWSWF